METQIFYWTGVFAWWCVMGCASLTMILMAVWLPYYLMIKTRRAVWHWLWAAKIAKHGFTQSELQHAYIVSGYKLPEGVDIADIVNLIGKVMESAEREKARACGGKNR